MVPGAGYAPGAFIFEGAPQRLFLSPVLGVAVALSSVGTLLYFSAGNDVPKPAGSGAGVVVMGCAWYGEPSNAPVCTGFTVADTVRDLRPADETATRVLYKYVTDLSTEPSNYAPTGIASGNLVAQTYFFTGVDSTTPVLGTSSVGDWDPNQQIVVPDVNVTRTGSYSILICNDWDFNVWRLAGSGGSQTPPSGFTAADPSTTIEYAYFYQSGLSTGNVGGSFGQTNDVRFAVIQVVLQPPSAGGSTLLAYGEIPFID